MNIANDWVVLDTNIWIFGLRDQKEKPSCKQLLQTVSLLHVKIPFQIFLELQANLNDRELNRFFRLIYLHADHLDLSWEKADLHLVRKYQKLGCKLGDAAISAHLEAMKIETLVSENRDFLEEIEGLPFRVLRAEDALRELGLIK